MGALSLARFTASAGSEFFAGEGARATSPVTPDRASSCPRRFPPAKVRSREARSPFAPERVFASRHSLLPELQRPLRRELSECSGISAHVRYAHRRFGSSLCWSHSLLVS